MGSRQQAVIEALQECTQRYDSRLNAEKTCLHVEYGPLDFGGVNLDLLENEAAFNEFFDTLDLYEELKELYINHDGMYQIPSSISKFESLDVLYLHGSRIWTIDLKRIPAGIRTFSIMPNGGQFEDVMWELRHLPDSIKVLAVPGCEKNEPDWPVLKYMPELELIDLSESYPFHDRWDDEGEAIDYECTVLKPWLRKYKSWRFDPEKSQVHIKY